MVPPPTGFVWYLWFQGVVSSITKSDPEVAALLSSGCPTSSLVSSSSSSGMGSIPYRAFLRSRPVQALMFTHFCGNWFHYTMLAWLPTYFTQTMSIDLMHAAQTALFPPLAGIAASALAGPLADGLISRGWKTSHVRKLAQGLAFLGPTACLLAACTPEVASDNNLLVAAITASLGLSSFSLAGLYCTHQDMSPKYASAMLGLTNMSGAIPGIIGVATVGFLLDQTQSWELALFLPSAVCMVAGAVVYTALASNEAIDFDLQNDSPFPLEKPIGRQLSRSWSGLMLALKPAIQVVQAVCSDSADLLLRKVEVLSLQTYEWSSKERKFSSLRGEKPFQNNDVY